MDLSTIGNLTFKDMLSILVSMAPNLVLMAPTSTLRCAMGKLHPHKVSHYCTIRYCVLRYAQDIVVLPQDIQ